MTENNWKLVDAFFDKYDLVDHHIKSYNDFVNNRIQNIIDITEPITLDDGKYTLKTGKVRIEKPSNKEADGSSSEIDPTEARLRNLNSNSAQIGQITYDQMKLELSKLQALRDGEGKILSPTNGIVTRCNVQTGEKTTDTTAILLADFSQGCKFSGLATEEDSRYIGVGDKVLLQASNGKMYKDLPVTTFSTAEEPDGGYRLTVQIPAGNLPLGSNVHLSFTKKSPPYTCCVPLSALRLDSRNQPFVLVVEQAESIIWHSDLLRLR